MLKISNIIKLKNKIRELEQRLELFENKNFSEGSENYWKLTFESSPNVITITRISDGIVTDINNSFIEKTGYTREEIIGKSSLELNLWRNPADRERLLKIIKSKGEIKNLETEFRIKDGTILNGLMYVKAINLENGLHLLSIITDITKIKQAKKQIADSEKKFRLLFDKMHNAFALHELIFDKNNQPYDYKFLDVNPGFEKLIGLKREQIISKTVKQIFPNTEEFWIKKYTKVALTGEPVTFENYSAELNKYFRVTAFSPAINQFATIFEDITERIEYENQLKIAKEKAEEADKLKSAFMETMSHEIRTPMNAIVGFSQLLGRTTVTDNQHTYVKNIISNGFTLVQLVNDIIDISQIESNQLKITKIKVALSRIIDEVDSYIQNQIPVEKKNNIKIIVNIKDIRDISLHTDPVRLIQVINNLMSNAVKYTEKGFIEFGYSLKDQKEIIFFVKDTGIGISPEHKDYIFDRFTKIEENQTKLYRGAGLGLAISKQLVNLLGGKIWFNSEINKGADFYFTIPLSN